jgi:hypothetical protein
MIVVDRPIHHDQTSYALRAMITVSPPERGERNPVTTLINRS